MKKRYLLAGSLGLAAAIAATCPVLATDEPRLTEGLTDKADPGLSTPLAETESPVSSTIEPVATTPSAQIPEEVRSAPDPKTLIAQGAPVTSVSQLSDVQPSDWAFQALQSLIERYGCIAGYPDGTFRGDRALTRYEFAAGTYACLNSLAERLGALSPEDLATIRRLQEEFAAELATLRGRVDALEARTTELEENQFSTTTKLAGQVIVAPTFGEDDNGNGRPTVLTRVRLIFNTSFTGNDQLYTQLQVGNAGEDIIGAVTADPAGRDTGSGVGPSAPAFSELTVPGDVTFALVGTNVFLNKLYYTFNVGEDLSLTVGPRLYAFDFVDGNSYAYDEARDFISSFLIDNPLIIPNVLAISGGAGAAFSWNPGDGPVTFRGVYQAGSPTNATPSDTGGGLFGDPYQASGEIEFSPGDYLAIRLQYTSAAIFDTKYNSYGVNAEATFGRFGLFGRYGFGDQTGYGPLSSIEGVTTDPNTFMAGVAVKDLFKPGSLLGLAAGQPYYGDATLGDSTQTNYEAFYSYPVNDNITVTPVVSVITDPLNSSTTPTVYQGTLRTVLTF